jgi:hypothetical protein
MLNEGNAEEESNQTGHTKPRRVKQRRVVTDLRFARGIARIDPEVDR